MTPEYIILHHSLTKDGATVSWAAIRRYHTQTLGWREIGYHFGVELVGSRYEILTGRLMTEVGAHCKTSAMNHRSLGICLVGNFDLAPPDMDQWAVALALVRSLCAVFSIAPKNVLGHTELAPYKSCPGRFFDLTSFRRNL